MSYHQIDQLLALGMAVVILTTFWYVFLRPLDTVSFYGVPASRKPRTVAATGKTSGGNRGREAAGSTRTGPADRL